MSEPIIVHSVGWVYILCFRKPRIVERRDLIYPGDNGEPIFVEDGPITHYVGWTQQREPTKRAIYAHKVPINSLVALIPNSTPADERRIKQYEMCPRCAQSLWYFGETEQITDENRLTVLRAQFVELQLNPRIVVKDSL